MRLFKRWSSTICLACALTVSWPPLWGLAVEDAIIAVVNEELITLNDLKDYVQSTYINLVAEGVNDAQIQAVMKDMDVNGTNKLIEDKLILSKANHIGIEVRETLVNERIDGMKEKYGSEQKLVEALIKYGATITDLKNKIRDQLKIKFVIDHAVKSKIFINPQEVTSYYAQNKDQFHRDERVNLKSIFINYGDNKEAALAKAAEVFRRAVSENDFENLVAEYSDGPSIGIVSRGQLLPAIEEIVFNLKTAEISPLIEVNNGIYICKLAGRTAAKIADLEDVRESISDLLYKQKFKDEFFRWIENLKKEAYIEIK